MSRKQNRKPKLIIKTRNGGYTKFYVNGKWQRKVTGIEFHAYLGKNGIAIECEYEKLKCNKNRCPIVVDDELIKEVHIVQILRGL